MEKRKMLCLIGFTLALFFVFMGKEAAAAAGLSVSIPDFFGAPGDSLTVLIEVSDTTGLGIKNSDIILSYDPDLLIAHEVSQTTLTLGRGWGFEYNILYGEVRIAMAGTDPNFLQGSGVLCEVLFEVKANAAAGTSSPLTLEKIQFNGGAILPQQVSNGSVLVIVPEISLEPLKAPVLSNVIISGSGFPPNKSVTVRFEDTNVLFTSTDGSGTFSGSFNIPSVPAGQKTITVISGDITKTVTLQVTLALTVSPAAGPKGTLITVTGSGVSPNERITIDFGTTPALTSTVADENGNFSVTFSANAQPSGSTPILARGTSGVEGTGIFQMQPTLEIEPLQGDVGTRVEVLGYGFKASGLVTIQFGTVAIAENVVGDSQGSFTYSFSVGEFPYLSQGYEIKAIDEDGNSASGELKFMLYPSIEIQPTSLMVGEKVLITGKGFEAQEKLVATIEVEQKLQDFQLGTTYPNGLFEGELLLDIPEVGIKEIIVWGKDSVGTTKSSYSKFKNAPDELKPRRTVNIQPDTIAPVIDSVSEDTKGIPKTVKDTIRITVIQKDPLDIAASGSFSIGLITNQELFNDGRHGDGGENDTKWVGEYEVKEGDEVNALPVQVTLIDKWGNESIAESATKITIDTMALLTSVTVNRIQASPGDEVTVTLIGENGGKASFSIEDIVADFPMPEENEGIYKGTYVVKDGINVVSAKITVNFTDALRNIGTDTSQTITITDTIGPRIDSVSEDTEGIPKTVGDTIRITVIQKDPLDIAASGNFSIGSITNLPLFNDGRHGDSAANDTIWVGEYTVKEGDEVKALPARVTLIDESGNESIAESATKITIDTIALLTSVTVNRIQAKAADDIVVTLTGESGGQASFSIEGVVANVPMPEQNEGIYKGAYIVADGINVVDATITVNFTDALRNIGTDTSKTIAIDSIPPTISAEVTDVSNVYRRGGTMNIKVVAEPGSTVVINVSAVDDTQTTLELTESIETPGTFLASVQISPLTTAADGEHSIEITATDVAGNIGNGILTVILKSISEFTVKLSLGINMISVPLKQETEMRLSDLAAYIGHVTMIIWHNPATGKFVSYMPTQPVTSPTNTLVEGGKGYILVMRAKKEVTFEGVEWDGTVSLFPGINMISVPVKQKTEMRLSDLAAYIGHVTMIIWHNPATGKFVSYLPTHLVTSRTNTVVEGGKGYIVVMKTQKEVTFEGGAWENYE